MSINIADEPPIPFTQATGVIPPRRRGRKAAASTLHRWATRGLRGVKLEMIMIGGTRCTSVAALQRFFDQLSALDADVSQTAGGPQTNQQRAAQADQELAKRWSRGPRRTRSGKPTMKTEEMLL
jgi:hypothetical protein